MRFPSARKAASSGLRQGRHRDEFAAALHGRRLRNVASVVGVHGEGALKRIYCLHERLVLAKGVRLGDVWKSTRMVSLVSRLSLTGYCNMPMLLYLVPRSFLIRCPSPLPISFLPCIGRTVERLPSRTLR